MGGALAALLALDLRQCQILRLNGRRCLIEINSAVKLNIFTFAQPRFGDLNLMNYFYSIVERIDKGLARAEYVRVVNQRDIVTHLPPQFLGYQTYPGEFYAIHNGIPLPFLLIPDYCIYPTICLINN